LQTVCSQGIEEILDGKWRVAGQLRKRSRCALPHDILPIFECGHRVSRLLADRRTARRMTAAGANF